MAVLTWGFSQKLGAVVAEVRERCEVHQVCYLEIILLDKRTQNRIRIETLYVCNTYQFNVNKQTWMNAIALIRKIG